MAKTIDDLYKKLSNYLEHRGVLPGAFFINGPWGCGKTTAIKNYFKERNDYLYISLNGVSSQAEIDRLVLEQLFPKWAKIKNSHFTKICGSLVSLLLPNQLSSKSSKGKKLISSIEDALTSLGDYLVLVFDDIERARMDLRTLFGCLGRYIEENNQSVILIGSEYDLIRMHDEDLDFKNQLLANIASIPNSSQESKKDTFTLENPYYQIKEKFIFDEFSFQNNTDLAVELFLDEKAWGTLHKPQDIEQKIRSSLRKHRNLINLRSIYFAREKLLGLLSEPKVCSALCENESVYSSLAQSLLEYSIKLKESLLNIESKSKLSIDNSETSSLPHAVADYLRYGMIDGKAIAKSLNLLCERHAANKRTDSIVRLTEVDWAWADNEDKLKALMTQVVKDFKNGEVQDTDWRLVATSLRWYQDEYQIETLMNLDEVRAATKECIKKNHNKKVCKDYQDEVIISKFAKPYLEPICEEAQRHNAKQSKEKVAALALVDYPLSLDQVEEIASQSLSNRQFLAAIGVPRLTNYIDSASPTELQNFIGTLDWVYRSSGIEEFYIADLPVAKTLLAHIEKMIKEGAVGKIRTYKLGVLRETIGTIVKRLETRARDQGE